MAGQKHGAHQKAVRRQVCADVMEGIGRVPEPVYKQNASARLAFWTPLAWCVPEQFGLSLVGLESAVFFYPQNGCVSVCCKGQGECRVLVVIRTLAGRTYQQENRAQDAGRETGSCHNHEIILGLCELVEKHALWRLKLLR